MTTRTKPLTGELLRLKDEIHQYALDYGLDFYPVIFEVCDYDTINIVAAQGGFPSRYPHWRFGMEYDQLSKSYAYGLQKIYELVINTNPCYAYLLNANHLVDQKIVMAHVYGHADFFKNNLWFASTDRSMMDVMANHGTKIRRYMEKYGQDTVEAFVDRVLSLENLLDVSVLFETPEVRRSRQSKETEFKDQFFHDDEDDGRSDQLKSFMRSKLFNPRVNEPTPEVEEAPVTRKKPSYISPRDIMMYLIEHAPLKEWQADILGILREEAYYFLPQRMTKIMNEGWASYWHSEIMTKKALKSSEIIEFADKHAGVMAMSKEQINPYKIGIELFRDIEYRWDTGRFGKEYNECTNMETRENWDRPTGLGREKIFEVRRTHNDITFIDEFFTREFCERMQLFTYKYNSRSGRYEIETRDFEAIKAKLLSGLTNFGQPVIEVESGNFGNRGELHLIHEHQGVDLDLNFASDTMKNIAAIWGRPVNLTTTQEGKELTYVHDGKEMKQLK
jgi:stage V sporulation protein R